MNYSLDTEVFALFKNLNIDDEKVANFAKKLNELLLNSDKEVKERVKDEVKILKSELKDDLKKELANKQDLEIVKLELQKDIEVIKLELQKDIEIVRQDVIGSESKLMKWSFIFWISQVGVILGVGFMIMKSLGKI